MYLFRRRRRASHVIIACLSLLIIGLLLRRNSSRDIEVAVGEYRDTVVATLNSGSVGIASFSSSSSSSDTWDSSKVNALLTNAINESAIKAYVDQLFKEVNLTRWSTVYQNQLQRQIQLARACRDLGLGAETPNFKTSDMYVNDSLKYIYCVVNKVACTTWKRVLLMASGQMTVDRAEKLTMTYVHNWRNTDHFMPRIRNYNLDEVKQRLLTHFKFMFVRHPLERLVSTYRDKFTKPAYYYKRRFGTKIIKAIRGANATSEALKKGNDVKFREMVLYLLEDAPNIRRVDKLLSDNHWRLQNDLCHPCYVRYDFIGHYETLVDDALFVLHRLGVADRVQFPNNDPDNRWKRKTADVARSIIGEISPAELDRVIKLYRIDSELFGYSSQLGL